MSKYDMIPTAYETLASTTNIDDFGIAVMSVLKEIDKNKIQGYRHALFDPRPAEQYDAVKAAFEKKGYSFKPVGVVAGVVQNDVNICW